MNTTPVKITIRETSSRLCPYVVRPDLVGAAFGDYSEAHDFETRDAAEQWISDHADTVLRYVVEG